MRRVPVNIKVYTRNNCQACTATKMQLDRHGVEYTEINVEDHPATAQALVDAGWRAMPVVDTGNESWSGMNMEKLKGLWA